MINLFRGNIFRIFVNHKYKSSEKNFYLYPDKDTGQLTDRGRKILEHTPMGKFGEPSDLFGATLWLLSPLSSFVTGIVLPVDGGFSAYSGV